MPPQNLAQRLKWRFIMHQTSRPILASPPPSRRSIQRFLAMERCLLHTLMEVCPNVKTDVVHPLWKALDHDIETHGVRDPEDRHALFLSSVCHHLEIISPYEAMAWWFVCVLTHAVGSWGEIEGLTYFHQWVSDVSVSKLEEVLTTETYHWSKGHVKECLDELDYAIRYRTAMIAMLLDDDV